MRAVYSFSPLKISKIYALCMWYVHLRSHQKQFQRSWMSNSWGSTSRSPIYPVRMHQGVRQQFYLSSFTTIIVRSRLLGIWATRRRKQSVQSGEKLALVCFESSGKAHECQQMVSTCMFALVAMPIDHACPLQAMCFLLMCSTGLVDNKYSTALISSSSFGCIHKEHVGYVL